MIVADFETRSEAELKNVGGYVYSLHPSTQPMCLAWTYDDEAAVHLWHPAYPRVDMPEIGARELEELHDRIAMGEMFEAHNVFFERSVWSNICRPRLRWPELDPTRLRCSAAKAAAYAMPRQLEALGRALRLAELKDDEGHRLMLKLSKPRKPRMAELKAVGLAKGQVEEFYRRHGALWHEDPEELERVFEYCRQDVRAERAASRSLRDLDPKEIAVWQMDQGVNWRGVAIDIEGVQKAVALVEEERAAVNEELQDLSFGAIRNATDRRGFLAWARAEGLNIGDTQGTTIDYFIETVGPKLSKHLLRVLTLWSETNKSSTAKYAKMLDRVADDNRVRDILRYCAASTGRWGGVGIQPQNFPRGNIKDIDKAWHIIHNYSRGEMRAEVGDVMEHLSGSLRGAIVAGPGKELVVADYAAIEARVLFWLAGETEALKIIAEGDAQRAAGLPVTKNIYWDMTGKILAQLGTPLPPGAPLDKKHPKYQLGKQGILGLGYNMGGPKFQVTCDGYGIEISVEFAGQVVAIYRESYPNVPRLWRNMEAAAIQAVLNGEGSAVRVSKVVWGVRGRFLHCRLPSGRLLSYCEPRVIDGETPWGQPCKKLLFMGIHPKTKQWCQLDTYGGKLVENVDQAISRDLMADAMLRCEAAGYVPVLTVHDEGVFEVPIGFGGAGSHELERLMCKLPAWAAGLPMDAEGWRGVRYRK